MEQIDKLFSELENTNETVRYAAFKELVTITDHVVPWVYDKWYILADKLSSENSYQRNIGLKLLANLSKSDTENRIGSVLDKYLKLFEDDKFITSRQCIQNVWKIALAHDNNKKKIIQQLEDSYIDNIHLKRHGNLIKQDIIGSLSEIYQHTHDKDLLCTINKLVDSEIDDNIVKSLRKIMKQPYSSLLT